MGRRWRTWWTAAVGRRTVLAAACGMAAMTASLGMGMVQPPTSLRAQPASYKVGNELDGMASEFSDPTGMPPGIANAPCTASAAHPVPVVLVHGTFANENFTWQALAPMLADDGYCVFGLNYGGTSWTTQGGNHSFGIDKVENSAAELAAFVARVLAWTTEPGTAAHPTQVDIVGHSQGGMMPRYFIEHGWDCATPVPSPFGARCTQDDAGGTAGAASVRMMIGLAPSNHGADAYGLVPVFQKLFGANAWTFPDSLGCGACGEQEAGSPFMTALDDGTGPSASPGALEAVPGVRYTVIESAFDEVVTPAPNALSQALGEWPSAYLHQPAGTTVDNVLLQSQCPTDATDHIGIVYDPVALWDVVQALDGTLAPGSKPACPPAVTPIVSG